MFKNDYSVIGTKEVLEELLNYADQEFIGYGIDEHSKNAEKIILNRFNIENGAVYFLSGGTQTNETVISYLLKPYESVISCDTGHINTHEAGAVEGTGHKIITVNNIDGKLNSNMIEEVMKSYNDFHLTKPKMVYISNSTEIGTIYKKKELELIKKTCDKYNLYLFIDGARLSQAFSSLESDLQVEDLKNYCDVFYVGGTKCGLPYGEAVVFTNKELSKDFRYHIKNRGAMLAKGFILGIAFETLFKDDLYFMLGKQATSYSDYIRKQFKNNNIKLYGNSSTNQIFFYINNKYKEDLMNRYGFESWIDGDDESVLRLVTSFNNRIEDIEEMTSYVIKLK